MDSVPGKVLNSFRAGRTVQAVHDETVLLYSKRLFNSNGEALYDLSHDVKGELDLFALASPEDCEDIVAIYLAGGVRILPHPKQLQTRHGQNRVCAPKCEGQGPSPSEAGGGSARQGPIRLGTERSLYVVSVLDQRNLLRERFGSCELPRSLQGTRLRVRERNCHADSCPASNQALRGVFLRESARRVRWTRGTSPARPVRHGPGTRRAGAHRVDDDGGAECGVIEMGVDRASRAVRVSEQLRAVPLHVSLSLVLLVSLCSSIKAIQRALLVTTNL